MPVNLEVEASPLVRQARSAAAGAASAARVRIVDEADTDRLTDVAALFVTVWGTSQQGAPIPADVLRSISHAGCIVTAAYAVNGALCGAAVAIVSPENASMYSLIAGVLPDTADSGVGFALKQHQRAWGLARGLETMTWTFDPLVSRNARFNLTKLGAHASEYLQDFYGPMEDEINADDESDRLVAVWPLTSERTVRCSEGFPARVELPDFGLEDTLTLGPDGNPALVRAGGSLWCRAPGDIVALRGQDSIQAAAWRTSLRNIFTDAFASGHTALGVTRTGWYRLAPGGQQ
jgi:predicted GNAT superfamily acetyltransferase